MSRMTKKEERFFKHLELEGEEIEMWKIINGGFDPDFDVVPEEETFEDWYYGTGDVDEYDEEDGYEFYDWMEEAS